jgi:putative ABC transport system ATP-binding protein
MAMTTPVLWSERGALESADNGAEPTLRGIDLSRTFGSGETMARALRGVTLEMYAGQIALLMGPSGSGKSTLLAVLSGLLRPDEGKVLALGQDIWNLSAKQQEAFRLQHCGFIFQGYNLFPALTARQQLEMVLRWGEGAGVREARRRADEILALLGLSRKAHLRPAEMSGGEKQRVAIGRALVKNPTFCFADEPTSALDWVNGEQVVELLRAAAHERGATILVVAHDARIVPFVDRVFYLEDGCLKESDIEVHGGRHEDRT